MGFMVVRNSEIVKVHINEIETLIIEDNAVSLTAYLLSELVKRKVKVIFCDEKRMPSSELIPYYGSHDTSAKVRKQMEWSKAVKSTVWTEIVSEKIRKQAEFLDTRNRDEANMLYRYVTEMQFGDETNREGHAAKVYFNTLFGKNFSRSDDNPINAALNYGYSIILSMFSREIVANGYITQIGLFHDNMFNQFNLASDLMEPYRVIVDRQVVSNIPDQFEKEEKHKMLNIINSELYVDGRCETVSNAIKIYTRSVLDAINENDISLIKFYRII